jgi:hypothetical protein
MKSMSADKQPVAVERRCEARRAARGGVRLRLDGVGSVPISGDLADLTSGGFRARHNFHGLRPGQIVSFEHAGAAGHASVVWTRIAGESVESGFRILSAAGV